MTVFFPARPSSPLSRRPRHKLMIDVVVAAMAALSLATMPIDEATYNRPPWWPHSQPAIYPTAYSWKLGGVNCDSDCGNTSLTTTGDELHGWTAACPVDWLGYVNTSVVSVSWDGGATWVDYWCIDTFGSAENQHLTRVDHVPVYRMDFAHWPPVEFPYHGEFNWNWRREWRPMSEFYALREQRKAARVSVN